MGILGGLLLIGIFFLVMPGLPRTEWFLAPGCLVFRKSRSWTAILCTSHGRWAKGGFSEVEILTLLRSWLSPLPPPEAGRLSDLE
jgi:hypothetical protein